MANRDEVGLEMTNSWFPNSWFPNSWFSNSWFSNSWFSNSYVTLNFGDTFIAMPPIENADSVIPSCDEDAPPEQFEDAEFYDARDSSPPSTASGKKPESVQKQKLYELDDNAPNITEGERKRIKKPKSCMNCRNKQKEEVNKFVDENKILRTQLAEKDIEIRRLEAKN